MKNFYLSTVTKVLMFLIFMSVLFSFGLQILFWKFFSLVVLMSNLESSFFFVLLMIVFTILGFSMYYLSNDTKLSYYLFFLLIFIFSMILLNFSFNSLTILISWDLLGVSSFFLVLFYNNWESNSGALNTVLTNRMGDYFLFIFFIFLLLKGETLNFSNLLIFSFFFLILGGFTKSAIFPFSGWLPKAMSAPTPVSSLVHSSTLVTAGLILLMKFKFMLKLEGLMKFLFFFGLITMFFSSLSALFEVDMKKIIALSTLSQMGFMMMMIGFGLNFLVFLHLISHALFKSLLFIQMGFLIHNSYGGQDSRFYKNLKKLSMFVKFSIFLTLFMLMGLFFSSGLVSKDLILESLLSQSFYIFYLIVIMSVVYLTYFYSLRLFKGLMKMFNSSLFLFENTKIFNFLCLILFLFSFFFIWFLSKNFFFISILFLFTDVFVPVIYFFLFFFIFQLVIFVLSLLLKFSFMVDFFPKSFSKMSGKNNFQFMDFFLFFFNMNMMNKILNFNVFFMNYLKLSNFSFMFYLIFIFFFIF